MTYVEERIEKLKSSCIEDYSLEKGSTNAALQELAIYLRKSMTQSDSPNEPFLYFEKAAGNGRILGIRIPSSESYLIYRCVVDREKDTPKYLVSIKGISGPESFDYLKATAKLILPFFKRIEEYYPERDIHYASINIINLRTGQSQRKDISSKTTFETTRKKSL